VTFSRLLLHPVLLHRRSRTLLFWYALSSALMTSYLWWRLNGWAGQAGLSLGQLAMSAPPLGKILFQPYIRAVIIVLSAALATGLTAISVVGPIRRIEEWLAAWEVGLRINPLKVREGDQYETMIRLFNELHKKSVRTREAQPRRSRTPTHKPLRPRRLE
jgi:hypothetical protein